ncbi:MAG TPA: hypothetical protein VMV49_14770, partial [Candidatus Deferrimicrobium sp.]|nr:hypothetical protein [Candidatus Deferrimicrobium sp.]
RTPRGRVRHPCRRTGHYSRVLGWRSHLLYRYRELRVFGRRTSRIAEHSRWDPPQIGTRFAVTPPSRTSPSGRCTRRVPQARLGRREAVQCRRAGGISEACYHNPTQKFHRPYPSQTPCPREFYPAQWCPRSGIGAPQPG